MPHKKGYQIHMNVASKINSFMVLLGTNTKQHNENSRSSFREVV